MSTPLYSDTPITSALMATPGSRLRDARVNAGYRSAKSAAEHNGWAESTYRAHEHAGEDSPGARNYGLDDAEKYGNAFGVNPRWLWIGEDSGQLPRTAQALPNAATRVPAPHFTTKRIPVLGHAIGGKDGRFLMNGLAVDTVVCPPGLENVPDAYAVFVVGESMEPRYYSGEVVFVHPNRPYRRGNFVIVQIKNPDDDENPLGFIKQYVTMTSSRLILHQFKPDSEIEFDLIDVVSVHRIVFAGDS